MPKLTGIFSSFPDIDQIPAEDISLWLKPSPGVALIENYLGNKILYPQTIPVTQTDLAMELAILREVIKRHPQSFQKNGKSFIISSTLLERIPDLYQLALALVDVLKPKHAVAVMAGVEVVGSVIRPQCQSAGAEFSLEVEKETFRFKAGSVTKLKCLPSRCHINFKGQGAKLFGKNEVNFEVAGGSLGLLVDGRELL